MSFLVVVLLAGVVMGKYQTYDSLNGVDMSGVTAPIKLQMGLNAEIQEELAFLQSESNNQRYDAELHVVKSGYSPENLSYRQGLYSSGLIYGIVGMMIILSQSTFVFIKYGLKRTRNKKLNRFRKKYNRKEKTLLYGLFGLLTLFCVGFGVFYFFHGITKIRHYLQVKDRLAKNTNDMLVLTQQVDRQMLQLCADSFCSYTPLDQTKIDDVAAFKQEAMQLYQDNNFFVPEASYRFLAEGVFLVVMALTIKAIRNTNQKFFHVIGYVFLFISAFNLIFIWLNFHQYYLNADLCVYSEKQVGHPERFIINKGAFFFLHKMKEDTLFSLRQTQQYNYELMLSQMDSYAQALQSLKNKDVPTADSMLSNLKLPENFINQTIENFIAHDEYQDLKVSRDRIALMIPIAHAYRRLMNLEPIQRMFKDFFEQNCLVLMHTAKTVLNIYLSYIWCQFALGIVCFYINDMFLVKKLEKKAEINVNQARKYQ